MFPDSKNTQNYSQHKTKVKYIIQFGIAPYVKEILIKDVKGQPFSFKFDKTTTRQVKKRYDAYIQYHSRVSKMITTSDCGYLIVGHCLGMDCPSVNKSFVKKLIGCFEKDYQTTFLTLGSWTLDIVNSAFRKSITNLSTDIDQYACDLHFFFKYSSSKKEDLKHARSNWRCCMVCFKAWLNKVVYYHKGNS